MRVRRQTVWALLVSAAVGACAGSVERDPHNTDDVAEDGTPGDAPDAGDADAAADPDTAGDPDATETGLDADPDGDADGDIADEDGALDGDDVDVEDDGTALDADETGEDADPDTSDELPPNPLPKHEAARQSVYVHVVDSGGDPVVGGHVALDGRNAVTNSLGDAVFHQVLPGEQLLVASAPGHIEGLFSVEIPHLNPVDVEIPHLLGRHIGITLLGAGTPQAFVHGLGDVVAVAGPARLTFDSDGFTDLEGSPYASIGTVTVTPIMFGGPLFSSSMTATSEPGVEFGDRFQIAPYGGIQIDARDALGLPLQLAAGTTALARITADTRGLAVGGIASMWTMNPATGVWEADGSSFATVVGTNLWEVEIPHLSRWVIASPAGAGGCVQVRAPLAYKYPGAELRVQSGAIDETFGLPFERGDALRLTAGEEVTVSLLIGGTEVDSGTTRAFAQADADDSTCFEMSDPLVLEPPAAIDAGSGPNFVRLIVDAEGCPATSLDYTLRDAVGSIVSAGSLVGPIALFDGVAAGEHTLTVSAGGVELASSTLDLPADCGDCEFNDVRLVVPAAFRQPREGVCTPIPCIGAACDSCVAVTVTDAAGASAESSVYVYEPASVVAAAADGAICIDVADGAARAPVVWADATAPAAVALPDGASCETGGCAQVALVAGPRTGCGSGEVLVSSTAQLAQIRDASALGMFDILGSLGGSWVRLQVLEGAGTLTEILGTERVAAGATYAFTETTQDADGQPVAGDLVYRSLLETGLTLEVRVTHEKIGLLGTPADDGIVRVIAARDVGGVETRDVWSSASGAVSVQGWGEGLMTVRYDGPLERDGVIVRVQLSVTAKLRTRAEFTREVANLFKQPL
ncbi:MAG: carboxypeptidase regulatory-like domain-containing protein, partial [Dehalococcoidia bacterium]|nr:carboxypeptidase regulatory-like domain-containing protein [Dehalococcoidia bacterium]